MLGKLPGAVQRWYWNSQRLADAIDVEIPGRGDPIYFNQRSQRARIRLRLTNLAPFPVVLDRARLEIWSNGYVADVWYLARQTLTSVKPTELLVKGLLGADCLDCLRVRNGVVECDIQVDLYLTCKVREFVKHRHQLGGVKASCPNVSAE